MPDDAINPNSVAGTKQQSQSRFNETLTTFPAKQSPHGIMMIFKKYDYKPFTEGRGKLTSIPGTSRNSGRTNSRNADLAGSVAIQLPFPVSLTDSNGLRINGFERNTMIEGIAATSRDFLLGAGDGNTVADTLNRIGGATLGAARSAGAFAQQMIEGGLPSGDTVQQQILDLARTVGGIETSNVASAAAYLLRSKLPGDIGKSVDNVLGQVINPRETLAFEGVDLKTHSFSWQLFPSNQEDSNIIREIVRIIKRNSLPEVSDLIGIKRAVLNYPSTVDMYLLGINDDHWMKFKTSMVTSFSVNYGEGGIVSIIKGGKPAAVTLSMNFTELEIESANDHGVGGPTAASVDQAPQE